MLHLNLEIIHSSISSRMAFFLGYFGKVVLVMKTQLLLILQIAVVWELEKLVVFHSNIDCFGPTQL